MSSIPAHVPHPSLLSDLAQHTGIDIDCNDPALALHHNTAASKTLFGSMTTNQFIVRAALLQLQREEKGMPKIMSESVLIAKDLLGGKGVAQGLELETKARLGLGPNGLGDETEERRLQQLVVDVATVKLGLLMLPHISQTGYIHSQTLPSYSNSSALTASHARRLVTLYTILSSPPITASRIVIKIPTTRTGIIAMRTLESEGINTLSTAVFSVEQGLAAAEAGGASFVSPYLNALEAHFYEAEKVPVEVRRFGLDSLTESTEICRNLQKALRLRPVKMKMTAASFLQPIEVIRISGVDRVTIPPLIIAELASTPLTPEWKSVRDDSLKAFSLDGVVLSEREKAVGNCQDKEGGWLDENSEAGLLLQKALDAERTKYLLDDALRRFGEAEVGLREMASVSIRQISH